MLTVSRTDPLPILSPCGQVSSVNLDKGMCWLVTIARNLKFYPLSLKLAILESPLKFLATIQPSFQVTLCTGAVKDFMACSIWELLNLTPATVLGFPDYLYSRYGISQTFLQNSMYNYSIQTVGKNYLERYFTSRNQPSSLLVPPSIILGPKLLVSWIRNPYFAKSQHWHSAKLSLELAPRTWLMCQLTTPPAWMSRALNNCSKIAC